jgi:transcriptional regulator with XRE-family HTH domain
MGRHKRMKENQPGRDVLGRRLHEIRLRRGLKLTELGEATGLSHSFLSQVENSLTYPSVSTLWEIAEALDSTPAELLAEPSGAEPFVVRSGEGRVFSAADDQPDAVVRAHSSAHHLKTATVLGRFDVTSTMSHDGEEFVYVIAGVLEITIDKNPIRLEAGDSIVFDSSRPHHYQTLGVEDVQLVSVVTQPGAAAVPLEDDEFSRRRAGVPGRSLQRAS